MPSRVFRFRFETTAEGTFVELEGDRAGPFAHDLDAERHVLGILARWKARARELRGSLVRSTRSEVIVTLPDEGLFRGGEPLHDLAVRRWRATG